MSQYADERKSVDITLDGHDPAADARNEFTYHPSDEPAPMAREPSSVLRMGKRERSGRRRARTPSSESSG